MAKSPKPPGAGSKSPSAHTTNPTLESEPLPAPQHPAASQRFGRTTVNLDPNDLDAAQLEREPYELPTLDPYAEEPLQLPGQSPSSAQPAGLDAWADFDENATNWLSQSQSSVSEELPAEAPATADLASVPQPVPQPTRAASASATPERKAAPGFCLVALSGDDAGRSTAILWRLTSVGRGSKNTLVLNDPSVSREHGRLLQNEDGTFSLEDLESGNGTFVNGARVGHAVVLSGDEIAFGNAAFRLTAPEYTAAPSDMQASAMHEASAASMEATRPAAKPAVSRSLLSKIGAGALLVVVGLGVWYQVSHRGEARRDGAFNLYLQGVQGFHQHQWAAAEQSFVAALGIDPQNAWAPRYITAIEREKVAEEDLAQAVEARRQGDLVKAYELAAGVLDSTFRQPAQALLKSVDDDLEARLMRAQKAFNNNQLTEVPQLLQPYEAVHHGRPVVTALLVQSALRSDYARIPPVTLVERAATRHRPGRLSRNPMDEANRAFINGNVDEALDLIDKLNSEGAAELRDKMERFAQAYQLGSAEHHNKRSAEAIRALLAARDLEASISAGACKLLADIDQKLADMYYVEGTQYYAKEVWDEAYKNYHAAIALVPQHAPALHKLEDLSHKALDILSLVSTQSDAAVRRKGLRTVMSMVAPDSLLWRQAKVSLDALP